jgi:hypothetical protein
MLNDAKVVRGEADGRFAIQRPLKQREDSLFFMDIGSGKYVESGDEIIRMETKVITRGEGMPKYKHHGQFIKPLDVWLEFAHNVLSPFFRQFIRPDVMEKFEGA